MIINDIFINVNEFVPNDNVKDVTIIITHGIAEYSKYYEYAAKFFQNKGFNVLTYDLRGHGKSFGKRGYVDSYKDFLSDLNELILYAKKKTKKVFLVGHSLGGVITNTYAAKYGNVDGVIISAAPSDFYKSLRKIRFLPYNLLMKNKKIFTNFYDKRLTTVNNYEKDILDLDYYYLKLPAEVMIRGMRVLKKNFKNYRVPLLVIHSKKDPIVSYDNSQNTYNKAATKDKEIILYENSYHNLFNDIEKDLILNDILNWVNKRI
ncbi:alpha/beta fold hydrolase [Haploplasma axanthum]|nr:alpha/beta fold hydrolase [Haploplasma axanthum]